MADATGRIPFWIIGTISGSLVIGLTGVSCLKSRKEQLVPNDLKHLYVRSSIGLLFLAENQKQRHLKH